MICLGRSQTGGREFFSAWVVGRNELPGAVPQQRVAPVTSPRSTIFQPVPPQSGQSDRAVTSSTRSDTTSAHNIAKSAGPGHRSLSAGVPIPTVAKRLGHANANVTLSIYAHALEADELAAAKIWDTAMTEVIEANRRPPKRSLAESSAGRAKKLQVIKTKAS